MDIDHALNFSIFNLKINVTISVHIIHACRKKRGKYAREMCKFFFITESIIMITEAEYNSNSDIVFLIYSVIIYIIIMKR